MFSSEHLPRRRHSVLISLFVIAISTRLLPLAISPYPFNNDGITECVIASDIMAASRIGSLGGYLFSDPHSMITPIYYSFLSYVSVVVGTEPFWIAQMAVSFFSATTVLGGYLIALQITKDFKGALAAGLVLSFFGTFVFTTGSAWKESLGVAMFVFLVYAYMNRHDRRMFVLEAVILATLPFIHHLVAFMAFVSLGYLTISSLAFGFSHNRITRRHLHDVLVLGVLGSLVYLYYSIVSLEKMSYINDVAGLVILAAVLFAFSTAIVVLRMFAGKSRWTLAPVPVLVLFAAFAWDYYNPVFEYTQGAPIYVFVLTISTCILVFLAWFGYEVLNASGAVYRAIPFCLLLPVLTLMAYAFVVGTGVSSHQILYRSFDFADLSLALGVSASVAYLASNRRLQSAAIVVLIAFLILSFPFAYATGPLLGVRHDTQGYEIDAIDWVYYRAGGDAVLRSDERISYVAGSIHDFGRDPYLPVDLSTGVLLRYDAYNLLLEEWTSVGVNAYPRGNVVVDEVYVDGVLQASDVVYIGGPVSNKISIFSLSRTACVALGSDAVLCSAIS